MKKVKIRGHQRAGNHYLAALIEANLFDSTDSERHHDQRGHLFPTQCFEDLNDPNILNVFIHRGFTATLNSVYNMRDRFGLVCTLDELEHSKLGVLFNKELNKCNVEIEINWYFKGKKSVMQVSSYFGMYPDMTLHQWWMTFVTSWLKEDVRNNVYVCRYEYLMTPQGRLVILKDIARLLNRPIRWPVVDITERVGYYSKGDKSWDG